MKIVEKLKSLLWLYRLQNDFEQFLIERKSFDSYKFEKKACANIFLADKKVVQ